MDFKLWFNFLIKPLRNEHGAATILSDLDGLLKRHYGDNFIETQQQTEPDYINTMPKAAEKPGGEDGAFRFPVRLERRQNGGAQNEDEQFRANDQGVRKQSTIPAKINIWAIELTGFAMTLSKAQVDAFVAGIDDEFEDALSMLKKDENRQCFGLGNGQLALVNGAIVASTALVIDTPGTDFFYPGMRIDIVTAAGAVEAANVKISSVAESTNTLTLAVPVTVSDNSVIVRSNIRVLAPSDGKEMMGLNGIADDNTEFTTFQGLSRLTYEIWQGTVVNASSAQLTSDILQRTTDKAERRSGKSVDTIVSHRNQRRQYLNLVTPLKRFADDTLDAGFRALDWNGIRWMVSHDCQRDILYLYPRQSVKRFEAQGVKLDDTDGSTVHRIPRTDTFESYYKHYANIGTKHPATVAKLKNLATLTQ